MSQNKSLMDLLNTPVMDLFKKSEPGAKKEAPAAGGAMPELPPELANAPEAKGLMSFFYRKWKDPAFLKQIKTLAAHMAADGVDLKNKEAVKNWLENNKAALESGKFKEPPAQQRTETYVKTGPDIGRNDPCACGSGKKYKKCCAK